MTQEIYNLVKSLKEEINNDDNVKKLNRLNNLLENDIDVIHLSQEKDKANSYYNDMLKYFKDDSKEVIMARKKLQKAKIELETHPLVKEYLATYRLVSDMYLEINQIIFSFKQGSSFGE